MLQTNKSSGWISNIFLTYFVYDLGDYVSGLTVINKHQNMGEKG